MIPRRRILLGGAALALTTPASAQAPVLNPPVIPFDQPRKLLAFGDSITFRNSQSTATARRYFAEGHICWINRLTGHALWFDPALNKGVNGDTTVQMAARFASDVLANAGSFDVAFILAGTNDQFNSVAPATTIANIQSFVTQLVTIGKQVVLFSILPRNSLSAAQLAVQAQINTALREWIKALSSTVPVVFVDCWRDLADPALTNGTAATVPVSALVDGIHPSPAGAYLMAKRAVQAMTPIIIPAPSLSQGAADLFDATNNPKGNLLTNPQLTGTGGTVTNGTGVVATSWTVQRNAGTWANSEVTLSKEAQVSAYGAAPGEKQVFTVNIPAVRTNNEDIAIFQQVTPSGGNFSSANQVYVEWEVDFFNMSGNLTAIQVTINDNTFASNTIDGSNANGGVCYPDTCNGLVFRTPLWTPPVGMTSVFVGVEIIFDASAAPVQGIIKLGNPQFRVYS